MAAARMNAPPLFVNGQRTSGGMERIGLGLIGSGFMGKTHSFGFATAQKTFPLPYQVDFAILADATPELAEGAGKALGFARSTGDWRTLVHDPAIDIVDITAPNAFHKEMALAAIAAGKHVYCEKPLAPRAEDALEMAEAAAKAGIVTQVGFNYLANPMMALARDIIAAGELGEIRSYRGIHAEDYMADADAPWTWRHDPVGGGAMADLGSHALATAEFLLGPIAEVLGDCRTVIAERPTPDGAHKAVEVDDIGRAMLRFASGTTGSIEANWVATGRKMQHDFEVYGSRGALAFSGERLNELRLYRHDDAPGRGGFRTIMAGPEHPPYGAFCVAPGHQLGFNDLKAIEIAGFLEAIAGRREEPFGFRAGHRIQHLVERIHASSDQSAWLTVD